MKLRDIQDAIYKKFTLNISAGKSNRATEKQENILMGLTHSSTISCGSIVRSRGGLVLAVPYL